MAHWEGLNSTVRLDQRVGRVALLGLVGALWAGETVQVNGDSKMTARASHSRTFGRLL